MDPISEDELKLRRRAKQYQHYQNYVDSLKKDPSESKIGKMKGKSIKSISEKGSSIGNIFNHFSKKDSETSVKKDSSETSKIEKMKVKVIKSISEKGSSIGKIFKRYSKIDSQSPESQK